MRRRELGRVEVMARVGSKQLRVVDAARLLRVSYRQAKRLWKRYREEGGGVDAPQCGRQSNRAYSGVKEFPPRQFAVLITADFLLRLYFPRVNVTPQGISKVSGSAV
jgi:hypothetical protein